MVHEHQPTEAAAEAYAAFRLALGPDTDELLRRFGCPPDWIAEHSARYDRDELDGLLGD
jgi:uroporphyrinogen-III synthase